MASSRFSIWVRDKRPHPKNWGTHPKWLRVASGFKSEVMKWVHEKSPDSPYEHVVLKEGQFPDGERYD